MLGRSELVKGKETIVRPGGDASFHLPTGHTLELSHDSRHATISNGYAASNYLVVEIDETEDEVIVCVGEVQAESGPATGWAGKISEPVGYVMPTLTEELTRLHRRWQDAGLPETEFQAWRQGTDQEAHLARIRRRLREAGY